ncbi:hypothetical protein MRX96_035848 [Rhipicephalus microplus]
MMGDRTEAVVASQLQAARTDTYKSLYPSPTLCCVPVRVLCVEERTEWPGRAHKITRAAAAANRSQNGKGSQEKDAAATVGTITEGARRARMSGQAWRAAYFFGPLAFTTGFKRAPRGFLRLSAALRGREIDSLIEKP